MPRNEWLPPDESIACRPRSIAAAGALFTDKAWRVLVVKPTYRDHWLFVGGQLDEGETPEQACLRGVREEIGLEVTPGTLLLVEWVAPQPSRPLPLIMFLFDGGLIEPDQVRLNDGELEDYRFLTVDQAMPMLSSNGRRRLPVALEARRTGTTLYRSTAK
jgi:8-oxo-dGTP pyrophosphatase MutT (NUDIX family)